MKNKGIAIIPIVVIIAAVLAFGVTGYFFYSSLKNTSNTANINANSNTTINGSVDFSAVEDARVYISDASVVIGRVKDADGKVLSSIQLRVVDNYVLAKFTIQSTGATGTFEVYKLREDGTESLVGSNPIKLNVTVTDGYVDSNVNPESDPTTDATKDWKTYTSASLGFSLKVPTDWNGYTVKETDNAVVLTHPADSLVGFTVVRDGSLPKGGVKVGEQDGKPYYFASIGDVVPEGLSTAFQEISVIRSTFQFTNPTAGWKTYTNSTFGWTVKYPTSWGLMDYANEDENPDVELIFIKGAQGLQKFYTDKRNDTLEGWKNNLLSTLTGVKTTVTELSMGGVKAIRIDTDIPNNLTYVGFRKGDVFVNVMTDNAALFTSNILSTFTFTK